MIRRISKYNDLKDVITAKQPNVISNVDWIGYFIQGYPDNVIEPEWSVSGEVINVIIPTDLLANLTNGILMRRVSYREENSTYPDGYYNLEIEDNMNIWLGDEPVDKGEDGSPYITESELNQTLTQTLSTYATQSWVEMKGYPQASWVTGYVQSYVSSALSTYSYTETDPTVPSWAKSATKPTYTASEVSALGLSQIWTGTSTEWAALTSEQQSLYTIALITE